jgi:23S rRNA (uracil1939-C5)-methyltransferase
LKVQTKPEFAVGYYEFNSHRLLPIEQCPISSPLINRAISAIWKSGQEGRIHAGIQEIELFTNADDSQLLGEIYCSAEGKADAARELAQKLKADLPAAGGVVVFQTDHLRPAEPRRIAAAGAGALTYKIASSSYRVSAGAFFQSNRHLIDELVSLVTKDLSGDVALDLYAGVGLFSSVLAKSFAQVIAVEASPTAHADLAYNSPANVRSVREIAELFLKRAAGELRPSFVVVDPPRNGLGETVVRSLARLGPERITYVSCDPATVARDLAGLFEGGYRIQQAHLVDLFPQTYHIESVFQLSR